MTAQTNPLSQRIAEQDCACTLLALRSWAVREGRWSEDLEPEYQAKFKQLTERWK